MQTAATTAEARCMVSMIKGAAREHYGKLLINWNGKLYTNACGWAVNSITCSDNLNKMTTNEDNAYLACDTGVTDVCAVCLN